MRKAKDITGEKFNRLLAIKFSHKKGTSSHWLFKCDCGNEITMRKSSAVTGHTKSCGCLFLEVKTKHGNSRNPKAVTPTYISWRNTWERCRNPNHPAFHNYGGRGIKVCERWERFENFLEDMGERPEAKSLDRINNDGNYEPGNCRWATRKEQCQNRRPQKRRKSYLYNTEFVEQLRTLENTGFSVA